MIEYEQIALELFGTPKPKGKPDYSKAYIEDHFVDFLYNPDEEESVALMEYLTFKLWLYYNFPEFIDKEIETDVWRFGDNRTHIQVAIRADYQNETRQWFSVSWCKNVETGGSCPCDTLKEVRERILMAKESIK